ncbi:MAG: hypothetical protein ABR537_06030 [Gemmatimonadales bacterium]
MTTIHAGLLASLLTVCGAPLAAQQTAVVEFDHKAGTARLIVRSGSRADTTPLGPSPTVRLPRSVPVHIVIVNTNTALYRYAKQTEKSTLPEVESVRAFMGRMRPYLPELRRAAISALGTRGPGDASANAAALAAARDLLARNLRSSEQSLLKLDDVAHGPNGLRDNQTAVVFALEQMRRGVPPESASERLRSALALGGPCQSPDSLPEPMADRLFAAVSDLLDAEENLQLALGGFQFGADPAWVQLRDSVRLMSDRVQTAMSDVDDLFSSVYYMDRLIRIVAAGCSHWSAGTAAGTMTTGQTVTLSMEARSEPEIARVADPDVRTFTVSVAPRGLLHPGLGFNVIGIPRGRFSSYSTRPVTGGVEVYQSGERDARYGYGASLGFTWGALDRSETSGRAVWLPEILLSFGAVRGFGVGAGFSWSFLKLSGGAMWVQHNALVGARAGDILPDDTYLRSRESFGPPRLYISLCILDTAPFARRLPQP